MKHNRTICLFCLILALLLAACSPALAVKAPQTGLPSNHIDSTRTPTLPMESGEMTTPSTQASTPTVTAPAPTPTDTLTPTASPTKKPTLIFKTSIGELSIESVHWVNEVNGVLAGPNERLLLIAIGKPGQSKLEPGSFSLQAFDLAMRQQSNGEVHIAGDDGTYAVCSMAGWVGSQHEMFAMAFRIPKTAKTVQLFWPGNEPIDLYPEE